MPHIFGQSKCTGQMPQLQRERTKTCTFRLAMDMDPSRTTRGMLHFTKKMGCAVRTFQSPMVALQLQGSQPSANHTLHACVVIFCMASKLMGAVLHQTPNTMNGRYCMCFTTCLMGPTTTAVSTACRQWEGTIQAAPPPIRLIGAALDTIYLTFGAAPTTSFSAASMFKLVDGYPGCCLRYEFEFKTPSLQPAWVRTDPTGVLIFQQPRFTAEFPADNTMVVRVKAVTPEGKHKTDWVEWKIKLAEAGPAVFNVLAPLSGDAGLVFEVGSAKTKLPAGNGWGGGLS